MPVFPVRTNQIPRAIPQQQWYASTAIASLMGGILPFGAVSVELYFIMSALWLHQIYYIFGFLCLVMMVLVVTCAEIAILIGRADARGKGLGGEAVYLLARHAFQAMNLHRVFAGTFNPAFVRCVEKLGWVREGVFRERIWANGAYHDQIWLAQLRRDFMPLGQYEPEGAGA